MCEPVHVVHALREQAKGALTLSLVVWALCENAMHVLQAGSPHDDEGSKTHFKHTSNLLAAKERPYCSLYLRHMQLLSSKCCPNKTTPRLRKRKFDREARYLCCAHPHPHPHRHPAPN